MKDKPYGYSTHYAGGGTRFPMPDRFEDLTAQLMSTWGKEASASMLAGVEELPDLGSTPMREAKLEPFVYLDIKAKEYVACWRIRCRSSVVPH